MDKPTIRVAILDMYNRHPNQGMRGIRTLLYLEAQKIDARVRWHFFDVRYAEQIPETATTFISHPADRAVLDAGEAGRKCFIDELWNQSKKPRSPSIYFHLSFF
jgi:hypothetical protein